MHHYYCR